MADVLIGSYPRRTGIWPGKDVDIFAKLTDESVETITPTDAYQLFLSVLDSAFPGRITQQPRSIKVDYFKAFLPGSEFIREAAASLGRTSNLTDSDAFEFSVDVVPAVHFESRWGIPNRNQDIWTRTAAAERWVYTDPEELTEKTREMNGRVSISGRGAYVPTVKAIRQIRSMHLRDDKPGGLYFELLVYEGFNAGRIKGDSWAEVTTSALRYLADRLPSVLTSPLCDPVLEQPYSPLPRPELVVHAAEVFAGLANAAKDALTAERCPAAAAWRQIFGTNSKGSVFEVPSGCRSDGTVMPVFAAASTSPIRGTNEAHGFGRD
ncbi:hypothetical protein JYT71_01575 [Acidimicrobiaceae bacterium AH-315-P05]|nr:hypothetical protein [Acidimicrobiaceae bacterium AH-315-P05]